MVMVGLKSSSNDYRNGTIASNVKQKDVSMIHMHNSAPYNQCKVSFFNLNVYLNFTISVFIYSGGKSQS